ncbi:MAG TPA: selenocysteine-specific translation elongation factor [Gemmatimonadetes bacterium]|nr:selenocysteine-specific translation elongation factor [Gemmatimonadota bacterium]
MRRLLLGTAGHIDHGKTALVRVLTGVDTDRLQEEKERGITIDLGFAELTDGAHRMGVVDVPGHEGFIRNMVAGATGVDLVLLVVAADEGLMPQTREHVHIVTLLGVERLVVALTKVDLVDEEWLELVGEEVASLLEDGPYHGAPIVPTSARTGEGIELLTHTLFAAAENGIDPDPGDPVSLPLDRVFTVHGTGTVVTGTLRSGRLEVGDRVRVLPGEIAGRVRGLQVHGREVEEVRAGERTAVALSGTGLDRHALARGQALVAGEGWIEVAMLTARIHVLPETGWRIEAGQRVRVHLGTAEVMARCAVLQGEVVEPGEDGWVQLRMESPVLARVRDAFVLRSFSPMTTIAGGRVAEIVPPRRSSLSDADVVRLGALLSGAPTRAVASLLELVGAPGVAEDALPVRTGLPPGAIAGALTELMGAGARVCEGMVISAEEVAHARDAMLEVVDAHHRDEPLLIGVGSETLRVSLTHGAPSALADQLLEELAREGEVKVRRGTVSRPDFVPRLTTEQETVCEALRTLYQDAGIAPPTVDELPEPLRHRTDLWPLLRLLEGEGVLTSLDHGLFVWRDAVEVAIRQVEVSMSGRKGLGPTDFRGILTVTRKHLMPLLAHFDIRGVTVRRGAGREVPGRSGTEPSG